MSHHEQIPSGRLEPSGRPAFSLVELLVVIAILALLIALTLGAVQRVRATATRTACQNNLRQVGLGLSHYASAHAHYPSGVTTAAGGYQYLSWHTRVLPYVEQDALWRQAVEAYRQYPNDITQSPPHPLGVAVGVYGCPGDDRVRRPQKTREKYTVGLTSYLGVSGTRSTRRDGMLFRDSAVRPTDVTDGTSNTVVVGERPPSPDFWFGWWYAGYGANGSGSADMILGLGDRSPDNDPYVPDCGDRPGGFKPGKIDSMCSAFHFWSVHSDGGHYAFADGSVRFLRYSADSILPALVTRAGGETVSIPE